MLFSLLIALTACVSPARCPTHAQILAAVKLRDAATTVQLARALETDGTGSGPDINSYPVLRISDVHCEDSGIEQELSANCTYLAAYPGSLVREVAKLSLYGDRDWLIVEALSVTLRRTAR